MRTRAEPPPPAGSGYDAFIDWASDGALEPFDEEIDIAIGLMAVPGPRCG